MLFHIDIPTSSIPQTILRPVQNAMRGYTWAPVDPTICSITLGRHDAVRYKKKRGGNRPNPKHKPHYILSFCFISNSLTIGIQSDTDLEGGPASADVVLPTESNEDICNTNDVLNANLDDGSTIVKCTRVG